ncbi:6353_t:CDS:2 [Paraglomus occultum]|uniref:6353_t:CDS:1 n=1 Tax=Paraglomus occultum TaxID=144539 RepID=A0A9N9F7S3_9GLOM|nr:6353_t:CDS:2 [Paraglomus occultum]
MKSSDKDGKLTEHETQILYELRGILHAVKSINLTLAKAVHTTSPGGPLHDAQRHARLGLAGFSDLIRQVSGSGFADDGQHCKK